MGLSLVSLTFFCFFAVVFAAYWLAPNNALQEWLLLLASYVFYAFFDYRFCFLLFGTSLVGYMLGRRLTSATRVGTRKALLITGLTVNLLVLGTFKYFDFFSSGATSLLSHLGFKVDTITLKLLLPVGISFYLFKILSYLIDVYRGDEHCSAALLDFLVYVAFFPQLLSGPIDRAGTFLPQLRKKRTFDYGLAVEGTRQILWGLFKKLALADGLASVVSSIFGQYSSLHGPELAFGAVLFSFQIYCDFSGYTDISIGLSKLLGLSPMRNFAYPYFSQNVAEFWRRWNISVSSWFRDYVYISMGGSRVGTPRLVVNIAVTFLLSGLWHGASITFLAWGTMLAAGVVFTSLRRRPVLKAVDTPGGERPTIATAVKILVTFAFISLSWVFFRSGSMSEALGIIARIFTPTLSVQAWLAPLHQLVHMDQLSVLLVAFIVIEWLQRRRECALELATRSRILRWSAYTLTLWLTILLYQPDLSGVFLYFRF